MTYRSYSYTCMLCITKTKINICVPDGDLWAIGPIKSIPICGAMVTSQGLDASLESRYLTFCLSFDKHHIALPV